MLDLKYIRDNITTVKTVARNKNCSVGFDHLLKLDIKRRELIQRVEEFRAKQNMFNDEIAQAKKNGKSVSYKVSELRILSQKIKNIDAKVSEINNELLNILVTVPNIYHPSVPIGNDKDNKIVREWGTPTRFNFDAKDHLTLGESLGYIDVPCASKITGSGFVLFKGFGARLERALINFMIDFHTKKHNYAEVSPPFLVNRVSMLGTGQLPKLEDDMYMLKDDDLFLVPTAEVPVTNMHRNEILKEEALPIKYVSYTPCFRREAGSYGKDTKGLSRVHQFDKVELVKFVKPENSYDELESLVNDAEEILQALKLPYRVVLLASGELSFAASKCYDLEVWAPGTKKWYEVSSCSAYADFQARRANIKFRDKTTKKAQFVHTLNGSGVALARLFLCILENGQKEDGTVEIPEVLKPYISTP